MRIFEQYTNEELILFANKIANGNIEEDDELKIITEKHFGRFNLINLIMLSSPLSLELALRLKNFNNEKINS